MARSFTTTSTTRADSEVPMKDGQSVSVTQFSLLEQRVGGVEKAVTELTTSIHDWMTSRQQSPWKMLAIFLGVLVPLGWLLNMYITTAFSPIAAKANANEANLTTLIQTVQVMAADVAVSKVNDAQSISQRQAHESAITKNIEAISKLTEVLAHEKADRAANEREIETQMDAAAQAVNLAFAAQQRDLANFQNALHELGAKMPPAPAGPWYFPNISNRNHRGVTRDTK